MPRRKDRKWLHLDYWLDALERVVWTGLQVGLGVVLELYTNDGELGWGVVRNTIVFSVMKVLVARKIGDSNTAQAIPGVESTYKNDAG